MPAKNEIRLWVVIPVYGNWEDTLECLAALESQSTHAFRVLMADDGSPTPPPACVHRLSFLEYLRWENRGFAENCNTAAEEAIAHGATHLLFLNSDTVFSSTFVQQWLEAVDEMPDLILSPLIYRHDRRSKIWFSGGNLTIWVPFFRQRQEFREITPVDVVTGCALLVPVLHWQELGGFDKTYVTYYEDFDFTLRAKRGSIRTYVVPNPEMRVWHKASGSYRSSSRWAQQYRLLTSSLIFIRTHYQGPRKGLCLALKCAHLISIMFLCLPELPEPRALWKAVRDGCSVRVNGRSKDECHSMHGLAR